jgi:predicted acyl esterase
MDMASVPAVKRMATSSREFSCLFFARRMAAYAYGKQTVESWANYFVPRGYIAIGQDIRGRLS